MAIADRWGHGDLLCRPGRHLLLALVCGLAVPVSAQPPALDRGTTAVELEFRKLLTTARVLQVVAHPDDEDGPTLAYCARGLGADTMLFSITRGEGGANLISSHFFDELGALRTLEHLKAASYYGNRLFYSRAADYGYSKTLAEAMEQWDGGRPILEDLVEVIRRERPHVLISRFRGDPRDGHGHHQMAGVLARRAFEAAADPAQFPEQLQRGLQIWQVQKLYVRAGSRWRTPDDAEWTLRVPTGTFDPVLGLTYAQLARIGLGFQRSQGMSGRESDAGKQYSYYRLAESERDEAAEETSLLAGVEAGWAGLVPRDSRSQRRELVGRLVKLQGRVADVARTWRPETRDVAIGQLASVLKELRTLLNAETDGRVMLDLARRGQQIERVIALLAGLVLDVWAEAPQGGALHHATRSTPMDVRARLTNQSAGLPLALESLFLHTPQSATGHQELAPQEVAPGDSAEYSWELDTKQVSPTRPHWQRDSIRQTLYQVAPGTDQAPLPANPFYVQATVRIADVSLPLTSVVRVRRRHPKLGRQRIPLVVAPELSLRFAATHGLLPQGQDTYEVSVIVRNCTAEPGEAKVSLDVPQNWEASPKTHTVRWDREDQVAVIPFALRPPQQVPLGRYRLRARAIYGEQHYASGFETVEAADVGRVNIYHDAVHHVQVADVAIQGAPRVGYIMGSGDAVAESLRPLGIVPTMLTEADIASGDLTKFDVILVGVRAYAVREDVRRYNDRLLDFTRRGGVLVVQYQTPEFDQNFGPYPYEMGRSPEEVSEESAPVTVLAPEHRVLTTPNRISPADFEGWFEQRGSKFWRSWDSRYLPLIESHDTGQAPQSGGLLIAKYGNGHYVYAAYAWYRQLPQGVPGAYRLFANLLSLADQE